MLVEQVPGVELVEDEHEPFIVIDCNKVCSWHGVPATDENARLIRDHVQALFNQMRSEVVVELLIGPAAKGGGS